MSRDPEHDLAITEYVAWLEEQLISGRGDHIDVQAALEAAFGEVEE